MSAVVPLQAQMRILSVLDIDDWMLISYQIPGLVMLAFDTSLRKHVSSPRGSSVAP